VITLAARKHPAIMLHVKSPAPQIMARPSRPQTSVSPSGGTQLVSSFLHSNLVHAFHCLPKEFAESSASWSLPACGPLQHDLQASIPAMLHLRQSERTFRELLNSLLWRCF